MNNQPQLIMLVGLPGSGKSVWTDNLPLSYYEHFVYSTDSIIESIIDFCDVEDMTYGSAFKDLINFAKTVADYRVLQWFENDISVIWDQTNLTKKSRKHKLMKVPSNYRKIAAIFPKPKNWKEWLDRPGKDIKQEVLDNMEKSYQEPTLKEGFDELWFMRYSDEDQKIITNFIEFKNR